MRHGHRYAAARQLGLALFLAGMSAQAQTGGELDKPATVPPAPGVTSQSSAARTTAAGPLPPADAAPPAPSVLKEPAGARRPPSVTPEEASAAITKAPWPAVSADSSSQVAPGVSSGPPAPSAAAQSSTAAGDRGVVTADDGLMGTHQAHFYFSAGARATKISDAAYDPFATHDALAQLSLGLGRVFYRSGLWSMPLGVGWDYGVATARARGAETALRSHRLVALPELRHHFFRRFYGFAKLGVGVSFVNARLQDLVAGSDRTSDSVGFTADPALGVAFEVAGARSGYTREPRLWLALEGGYLWTTSSALHFEAASGAPARTAEVDLGDLALSGPSTRLSAALSF